VGNSFLLKPALLSPEESGVKGCKWRMVMEKMRVLKIKKRCVQLPPKIIIALSQTTTWGGKDKRENWKGVVLEKNQTLRSGPGKKIQHAPFRQLQGTRD